MKTWVFYLPVLGSSATLACLHFVVSGKQPRNSDLLQFLFWHLSLLNANIEPGFFISNS